MKLFEANLATVVTRYYLMMAVIMIGVFTNAWWVAILGLPIFLSAILAIKFDINLGNQNNKVIAFNAEQQRQKAA